MDLAFVNGVVWRPGEEPATAVACSGERISAIGSDAEIRAHINKGAHAIDARGGTIMPAFNDAHVHFLMGSRPRRRLGGRSGVVLLCVSGRHAGSRAA